MKKQRNTLLIILFVFQVIVACEPFEKVSEIPEVHFKSYTPVLVDTAGVIALGGELVFSFIDGNADFGINEWNLADTANVYLIRYSKVDGVYDSLNMSWYKIKRDAAGRLDRSDQNKTIQGEIKILITYFVPPPFDTIRYDFYIFDRAKNKSNVDSTSDIAF